MSASNEYGEIHTGDAWEPSRFHYCGDDHQNMPIALIIFGETSHFGLHGTLATTPITFTLSLFNQEARNNVDFWRPLAYISNLGHGDIGSTSSEESIKDKHKCIRAALKSIAKITRQGSIPTKVKGGSVIGKVWIHYIMGDTPGNNRWVGHYNNSGVKKRAY